MILLIDTNIIIDILLKREPFFNDSYNALKASIESESDCLVSASAATDIFYLLRKGLGDSSKAREGMQRLLQLVMIADVLALDIQTALSSPMTDFEDAVVSAVANRYDADYILTRNIKDFDHSEVKAITPSEYLKL